MTNLINNKGNTVKNFSLANKIKIASSLHAKKTATKVPTVIFLLIYKSLAATLIPHWGTNPNKAPKKGETLLFKLNLLEM